MDLCDLAKIPRLLAEQQPTRVFHLAALSRPTEVERDPELAERLNLHATAVIAEWCARNRSRLVFTSSDWVFDGEAGPYRETDRAHPATLYGQLKLAGEALCLNAGGTVARMGWILDDRPRREADFIHRSLRRLARGETVVAVDDELRTPIGRSAAADHLLDIGDRPDLDVVHVGGAEHISPYELLQRRAQASNLPTERIRRGSSQDLAPIVRPKDVRLETGLLQGLLSQATVRSAGPALSLAI